MSGWKNQVKCTKSCYKIMQKQSCLFTFAMSLIVFYSNFSTACKYYTNCHDYDICREVAEQERTRQQAHPKILMMLARQTSYAPLLLLNRIWEKFLVFLLGIRIIVVSQIHFQVHLLESEMSIFILVSKKRKQWLENYMLVVLIMLFWYQCSRKLELGIGLLITSFLMTSFVVWGNVFVCTSLLFVMACGQNYVILTWTIVAYHFDQLLIVIETYNFLMNASVLYGFYDNSVASFCYASFLDKNMAN